MPELLAGLLVDWELQGVAAALLLLYDVSDGDTAAWGPSPPTLLGQGLGQRLWGVARGEGFRGVTTPLWCLFSCSAVALLRAGTKGLVTVSFERRFDASASCCSEGKGGWMELGVLPACGQWGQVRACAVDTAACGVVSRVS